MTDIQISSGIMTAGCGIFLIIVGWFTLRTPKDKTIAVPTSGDRKRCIESYIELLQKINHCGTTVELSLMNDSADEFRSEFSGTEGHTYILEFYNNLLEEIKIRRYDLLINKTLSKVS